MTPTGTLALKPPIQQLLHQTFSRFASRCHLFWLGLLARCHLSFHLEMEFADDRKDDGDLKPPLASGMISQ
jgi:hypothetical protein